MTKETRRMANESKAIMHNRSYRDVLFRTLEKIWENLKVGTGKKRPLLQPGHLYMAEKYVQQNYIIHPEEFERNIRRFPYNRRRPAQRRRQAAYITPLVHVSSLPQQETSHIQVERSPSLPPDSGSVTAILIDLIGEGLLDPIPGLTRRSQADLERLERTLHEIRILLWRKITETVNNLARIVESTSSNSWRESLRFDLSDSDLLLSMIAAGEKPIITPEEYPTPPGHCDCDTCRRDWWALEFVQNTTTNIDQVIHRLRELPYETGWSADLTYAINSDNNRMKELVRQLI